MNVLDTFLPWAVRLFAATVILLCAVMMSSRSDKVPLKSEVLGTLHLLSFSIFVGMTVWVSFFQGIILMKVLDKRSFAFAGIALFAAFFRLSFGCLLVGISTASVLHARRGEQGPAAPAALLLALALVALNLFFFGPRTTDVLKRRVKLAEELKIDTKDPDPRMRKLTKRFGMYHGMSNLANLVALGAGIFHAAHLGAVIAAKA